MRMQSIDLSESMINIDALLDVYVQTQKDNGVDPGLEECDIEIGNDGELHVIKPKQNDTTPCTSSYNSCNKDCHSDNKVIDDEEKPWLRVSKLGLFEDSMSSELDYADDDEEYIYVCEYCSDVGFRKEYKPYICDTCNVCETCVEFENGECSGCRYSVYLDGRLYSEVLSEHGDDSYIDDEERQLLADLSNKDSASSIREADFSFTVLDYDHKY